MKIKFEHEIKAAENEYHSGKESLQKIVEAFDNLNIGQLSEDELARLININEFDERQRQAGINSIIDAKIEAGISEKDLPIVGRFKISKRAFIDNMVEKPDLTGFTEVWLQHVQTARRAIALAGLKGGKVTLNTAKYTEMVARHTIEVKTEKAERLYKAIQSLEKILDETSDCVFFNTLIASGRLFQYINGKVQVNQYHMKNTQFWQ